MNPGRGSECDAGRIRDAPFGDTPRFRDWLASSRYAGVGAVCGIFVILLGCVAYAAKSILLPVVAAVVIGSTLGPLADRARRRGVPPLLTAFAIVALFVLGLCVLIIAVAAPVSGWIGRVPELNAIFKDRFSALQRPLGALHELSAAINNLQHLGPAPSVSVDSSPDSLIRGVLSFLTPAFSGLVIFFASLLLFLAGREATKKRLTLSFMSRRARLAALRAIADIEQSLMTYVFTVTAINIGLGICTALAAYVIGVPNAAILGLVAAILNYVPYIGPATMTAILFLISLVSFPTLSGALLAPGVFLVLIFAEGQFITPSILGRRLAINPFTVFLAVVFWAWLWGPLGAFLAVPLLLIFTVVGRHMFPSDEIDLPG